MDHNSVKKKRGSFFRRLSLQSCVKRSPDHEKGSSCEDSNTRRQDSAPVTPIKSRGLELTPSRIKNFFTKRSLCTNAFKRTKNIIKLNSKSTGTLFIEKYEVPQHENKLRKSRSHDSLLSEHNTTSEIDLGVQVKSIHSSILGRENCFQVTTSPSKTCAKPGKTTYFACRSAKERDEWVEILSRIVHPDLHTKRRTENSLQLWILEAKGIPNKKKYFCELFLDNMLYARTSCKTKEELCFWSDTYTFDGLPQVKDIHVVLYREADMRRKKDKNKIIGKVTIATDKGRAMTEEWYPVSPLVSPSILSKFCSKDLPAVRIKHRFQSFDILPLNKYQDLLNVLVRDYLPLCEMLEPVLGVRGKADLAHAFVHIMHSLGLAKDMIADLIMLDINLVDRETLIFRGNTLATKSMEAYMRHVGDTYLHFTLTPFVLTLAATQQDLEVDPLKVNSDVSLQRQQRNLRAAVELAWSRIQATQDRIPIELREVFSIVHQRLVKAKREDLSDIIISASIFLRFLVPAILSPSLFGITNEYPNESTARNLTLVAKSIQTLANFTKFQCKENCMEFLNDFMEREANTMREFIRKICMPTTSPKLKRPGDIDLGKHLSAIHILLAECLPKVSKNGLNSSLVVRLNNIIQELNVAVDAPNIIYEQQK